MVRQVNPAALPATWPPGCSAPAAPDPAARG